MNKPTNLPENPEEKPPFILTCPSCSWNYSTTSANQGLILCKNCGTEYFNEESTQPTGLDLRPKKKTSPFKDEYDRS